MNESCVIEGIHSQYQYPILPTGCEVTAVSILLTYIGLCQEIVSKESLASIVIKEQDPDYTLNPPIGGNPYRAFIGSPYSKESFGVFHHPIRELIESICKSNNSPFHVQDLTIKSNHIHKYTLQDNESAQYITDRLEYFENTSNDSIDDSDIKVLENHLTTHKTPIVIWMTLELKPPRGITDIWYDVKNPSQPIHWVSPEHCALLSGYDSEFYYVHDPHTGKRESYDKILFLKRWRQMGRQAVTVVSSK
ncbi:hypothetical protein CYY_005935 [Polysphondylium violaceum]|uniref:Peptidase C39-like domain-containing protein n=1 Tax=Polysphondylium violaceum TaxID=133409 RepID=A0A8J4PSK7_9MYCE|nr:hypothetical protein CYY_005935 [Polysphondylium violaceum]